MKNFSDKEINDLIEHQIQKNGISDFIHEFILYRMLNYLEPTRKGTIRGDKIGFPSKKYHASILVGISNATPKEIAKVSGVSYDLIRKWKTEPDFRNQVNEQCSAFINEIIKRIIDAYEKTEKETEDYINGTGQNPFETQKKGPLDALERVMASSSKYNEKVLDGLYEEAIKVLNDKDSNPFSRIGLANNIMDVICYSKSEKFFPRLKITKILVEEIKGIIQKGGTLSDKDQRIILSYLVTLQKNIDNLEDNLRNDER
jgi:hypothetical protein